MFLIICWSLWGLIFLVFAQYKQVKKRRLQRKEVVLSTKRNEYELYQITKETKQDPNKGKYTIPIYEDFERQKNIKRSIDNLEEYINKRKDSGWD